MLGIPNKQGDTISISLINKRYTAIFLEKEFLGKGTNTTKIELDEVRMIEELTQSNSLTKPDLIRKSNPEPVIDVSLRRSDRESY